MNPERIIVLFIAIFIATHPSFSFTPFSAFKMRPDDKSRLEACIERLKSSNSKDREKAAIEIFHFADGRDQRHPYPYFHDMEEFSLVVEPLIHAFDDPEWRVRVNVASALGRVKDPRALESLERKLTDENEQVRKSIVHAFSDQEDPHVASFMIDRLVDPDPDVRWAAAYELGKKKSRAAIVPLIMVLESEQKSSVRQGARDALREIANGLDFGDDYAGWQKWLLKTLQQREGRIVESDIPENLNPIQKLIATSVDGPDAQTRYKAEQEIIQLGNLAFEDLFEALKNPDWRYRQKAARILANAQNSIAIDPLTVATKDQNADVRDTAKHSLETVRLNIRLSGDRKLVGEQDFNSLPGLKLALQHKEAIVRRRAAVELGKIDDPGAVDALISALLDQDTNVVIAARDSLHQRKEPEVVDAVVGVLQYESVQRKVWLLVEIIGILRDKHDPSSIHVLLNFLKHEDMSVRQHTIDVLGKFDSAEALVPLIESLHDESDMVKRTAAAVLANQKNPALIEPLIDALNDPDPFVKDSALEALTKITGQYIGDDIGRWQEWWTENQEQFQQ
jgi:HEAT repeat protein